MCSSPFIKTLTVCHRVSVYCFFIHILKKVIPIYTEQKSVSMVDCQTYCIDEFGIWVVWNLPRNGYKSILEGPTNIFGSSITLLYNQTMPIKHYCSTSMMVYHHLMSKSCLKVGMNSGIIGIWGYKSMVPDPTNMLRVFIILLYTQTMPNKCYCSTFRMAYHYYISIHLIYAKYGHFFGVFLFIRDAFGWYHPSLSLEKDN